MAFAFVEKVHEDPKIYAAVVPHPNVVKNVTLGWVLV